MRTIIKTNIKGSENIYVSENVDEVFDLLIDKKGFILLKHENYNKTFKGKIILKKSIVKMVKQEKT